MRKISITSYCSNFKYNKKSINNIFLMLDKYKTYSAHNGELSVVFMNNQQISKIHYKFMKKKNFTDVITFPYKEKCMNFIGEICISIEYAKNSSIQHNTSFSKEITLYIIHGWLHLIGYNDKNIIEANEMRKHEFSFKV